MLACFALKSLLVYDMDYLLTLRTFLTNLNSFWSAELIIHLLHLELVSGLNLPKESYTCDTFKLTQIVFWSVELIIHLLHLIRNNSVQVQEKSYTYCSYSCSIKKTH